MLDKIAFVDTAGGCESGAADVVKGDSAAPERAEALPLGLTFVHGGSEGSRLDDAKQAR